jgi:hypothetical protein
MLVMLKQSSGMLMMIKLGKRFLIDGKRYASNGMKASSLTITASGV